MNKNKIKIMTSALFLIGFIIGWYHLRMAMKGIFVFRNNEPLATWVGVIVGPLSTLPATFVALFKRKLGGYCLIGGGLISFTAFQFVQNDVNLISYAARVAQIILLPMVGLGTGFILLNKLQNQQIENKENENNLQK